MKEKIRDFSKIDKQQTESVVKRKEKKNVRLENYGVAFFILGTLLVAQLGEALRYNPEGTGLDPSWCHYNFSMTYSFRSHYGPGVGSASNRNEYREYFLEVKAAGA